MATIYNSDLTKELVNVGKLQVSRERIPTEIAEKVVPVIDVNPKHARVCNYIKTGVLIDSQTQVVATTPTDRDVYIQNILLNYSKDVNATTALISLVVWIDGVEHYLISSGSITLHAEEKSIALNLNYPIKLSRGKAITLVSSTAVGSFRAECLIVGYTEENINA